MGVYDGNGNELYAVYDGEGNRLYQAYDGEGNPLLNSTWVDDLPDSGYTFTDGSKSYPSKLLLDFGTTSFQSVTLANGIYYRASSDNKVYPYDDDLNALPVITLPSTGGHKNDGCYYDGKIYWMDGTADDPRALYAWNISANTLTKISLPISDNANGSKRVVAGICNTETEGVMYLVSRDQYNGSDIAHQTGDKMCVFSYNVANNMVSLLASFDWDCVYVQGCTYIDGLLYVACNTQTTGSASNYTGITIKVIDPSTWHIVKTMTCSGDFEPEGCDNITVDGNSYVWTGVGKWATTEKVVIFRSLNTFKGKSLSILGDSISTYNGYIPSGNVNFYTGSNCGVTSVDQTWWERVIDSLGMTLNLNNSWSGSRVSTTNGTESAGVTRASNLGTNPNVIIVYMGINDFNNEVATATFRSAYETMLDNIRNAYPYASLYCATLPVCERNGASGDPEINDDGVYLSEYNQIITEVATAKSVKVLDFANCGITYATLSTYMGDWESATGKALHPNADGMALIAQKAITDLLS